MVTPRLEPPRSAAQMPREARSALVGTGMDADQPSEDDEWLQRIIRGVNTQNRDHSSDFRSNEPEQVLLQIKFRDVGVFYERKRGEWREFRTEPKFKGFRRLSLPRLGGVKLKEDGSCAKSRTITTGATY